jgi:uncharacterized protein YjiS (DUF1127 family)
MKQPIQETEMIMSISRAGEPYGAAFGNPVASLTAAIRRLCARYVAWRMEQSAVAVLQSMSDRQLSDIGLSRSDITRAVRRSPADRAATREH